MANLTILTARESDAATLSSDGGWVTSLPLANLQDRQPTYVARSSGATSFIVDAAAPVAWDALALAHTNIPADATMVIKAATSSGGLASPAWTSGSISCWPASGRATDPGLVWFDVYRRFSPGAAYRWWGVDVSAPDVDIGRLLMGTTWQPLRNYSYDWDDQFASGDLRIVTPRQQTITDPGPQARLWTVPLNFQTKAEAQAELWRLRRHLGVARDTFVCLDPEADEHLHRYMMLATLDVAPKVVQRKHNVFAVAFVLRELI